MTAEMKKKLGLALLLLVTIVLAVNAPEQDTADVVKPVQIKRNAVAPSAKTSDAPSLFSSSLPVRTPKAKTTYDLFSDGEEDVIRSAKPSQFRQISKPVKARAPRLPFKYIGKMEEGFKQKVFLLNNKTLHMVERNEKFAENYQLESISEQALNIIYLPLNITQTLSIEK